jgi:hypothetical protein
MGGSPVSGIRVFEGDVPEGGFPFYSWYVGEGDEGGKNREPRQYFFACVTDDALYVSRPLESSAKRIAESNRLQQEQPADVFRTGQTFYFRPIGEVRCSKAGDRLELVREDGHVVLAIDDVYVRQCRKIFDDIRRRRAPHQPVEEGSLSIHYSLVPPWGATSTALSTGFLFSWMAYDAVPGKQFHGRHADTNEKLNNLLVQLTFSGVVAISAIVIGLCTAWLIYRWINPVPADVVRLERR